MGEDFLVYARKRSRLSAEETGLPKNEWSKETQLNAEADKYNERLPGFQTTYCDRTERMRWAKDDVDVIRDVLKNGLPDNRRLEENQPTRIILRMLNNRSLDERGRSMPRHEG